MDMVEPNRPARFQRRMSEPVGPVLSRFNPAQGGVRGMRIIATGMLALGNWGGGDADKEKLLKRAIDAGLTAREHEVFKLFTENPGIKYREVADKLGISVGAVGKIKSRIKKALAETE